MFYKLAAILFAILSTQICIAQIVVPNAGFEQRSDTSSTKALHWRVGSGSASVDNTSWKGMNAMRLVGTNGFASFEQNFPFTSQGLTKYKISAAIKTKNVDQFVGIGARVFDKDQNSITGYAAFKVSGTQDWKVYEGEFYSDEKAVSVRLFGQMRGSGEAWFDEVAIEEIPMSNTKLSNEMDAYIDEYFGLVKRYSIVRDSAYIASLIQNTKRLCAGHSDLSYCHNILKRYTTLKLNDGHSFFLTPQEWKDWQDGDKTVNDGWANFSTGKMLDGNVAYIQVPSFISFDTLTINKAVDSLQNIVAMLDAQNPKGWIIDVSGNPGGNAFVMLCGLGPVLGNGVCGYSESADGTKRTRIYNEGWTGWDSTATVIKRNPYHLKNPHQPVAILHDSGTGSAAEVVTISFRGKPNVKTFGQPTAGATTRIDNLEMSDGAFLNLAAGYDVDRNGVVYKGPVQPDVATKDHDEALREAQKWILEYKLD